MTWLPDTAAGATALERVFGLRPEAHARFQALYAELWRTGLDPTLLELCRLRIATLLGCDAECRVRHPAAVLDQATIDDLPRWPTSPRFDARRRACLAFAEQYVLDPHAIADADVAALRLELGDGGVAALTLGIAVIDALVRFRLALDVAEAP